MSAPRQPARGARGLLLVSGDPARAAAWVRRGVVACHVSPAGRWTVVQPSEPGSRVRPPYDDALTVLASRPVPARLRPALGFYDIDGRAVVTVTAKGWRSRAGWLVWQPGQGVVPAPTLARAGAAELVRAAGTRSNRAEVGRRLADPAGDVPGLLRELLRLLRLPGWPTDHGGRLVEPAHESVGRFEARVAEEARHRAEMEGW